MLGSGRAELPLPGLSHPSPEDAEDASGKLLPMRTDSTLTFPLQLTLPTPPVLPAKMKPVQQNRGCLFTNTLFCKAAERGVGMGVLEKQMNLCFVLFKMSNRVQKFIFNRRATQSA